MEANIAEQIANLLSGVQNNEYNIVESRTPDANNPTLLNFHQWANNRPYNGAFLFQQKKSEHNLWILLIDWRNNGNFYVVLFPENRARPIAEIHHVTTDIDGNNVLNWHYTPAMQDGRNEERRQYFAEHFHSLDVQIPIPNNAGEVNYFIDNLFVLSERRLNADQLGVANQLRPEFNQPEVPQGNRRPTAIQYEITQYQRDPDVKAWVLQQANGECEACGQPAPFNDSNGQPFLEVHHVRQLADNGSDTVTNTVALCPNCHKEAHYGENSRALVSCLYERVTRLVRE